MENFVFDWNTFELTSIAFLSLIGVYWYMKDMKAMDEMEDEEVVAGGVNHSSRVLVYVVRDNQSTPKYNRKIR